MSQTLHFGTDANCTCQQPTALSRWPNALLAMVGQVVGTMHGWLLRSRQRHALGELDDRSLRDIGVSRAAAAKEAAKPFWM